ncbi:metalloregulator ArsR/SmtB family transcription factor [Winogradskyella sp. SYSU M77433]|uniref:ArsR/SmtB family transcription factor n=1 Tax=Winogradskyella sp. SYSU M77433 TaxID=3042722 RepID=UPI002480C441|nr:metalloregulator ArsR/SmtB family transcription factor [Winogradskyella sp. SYSU M77433]MDH7914199.1 metalloregulator ArsR/SmtB family transcription factor [Winogradskyella sp. SYSU M77433]
MDLKQVEKISKALSDINRLKILQYMQKNKGKLECTHACNLLSLAQPSVSHHIKKLVEAELISQYKIGRNFHYSLNNETWDTYQVALKSL